MREKQQRRACSPMQGDAVPASSCSVEAQTMARQHKQNIWQLGRTSVIAAMIATALSGCAQEIAEDQLSAGILPPVVNPITETNRSLRNLPPPPQKIAVAVYNYSDQTGQFKPSETTQTLSKAVTQGATSILIKALQDVGEGSWFTVVERERIDNLLKERNIITQMRALYLGEKVINPQALPPLLFAAIIFEGGIIGYDTNIQTGGVGAKLLGIGGDVKYRLDTITIYLRAVSTKTGQVLASVTTHKTIASIGLQGGIFKYIAVDKILEAEAGFTKNEPDQLAVQQAIEKAVYTMVLEGAEEDIWSFADKRAQSRLLGAYHDGQPAATAAADAAKTGEPGEAKNLAAAAQPHVDKTVTSALPAHAAEPDKPHTPPPPTTAAKPDPAVQRRPAAEAKPAPTPWSTSVAALPPLPDRAPEPDDDQQLASAADPGTWAASVATVRESYGHSVNRH
jgi:curli production assembly/transport component CsgG